MEELAGWIVISFVAWWFYKSGKSIGSRKGYNVGRNHSKRNHRPRR